MDKITQNGGMKEVTSHIALLLGNGLTRETDFASFGNSNDVENLQPFVKSGQIC